MRETVRAHYEAFPDPAPAVEPIAPAQLDRIDDSLHFGWSWHRQRFCFRRTEGIAILDAGCGTGLSTLGLARLNPGASVVGVDASPGSLELARRRAEASGLDRVVFREHDLDQPLPGSWGPFDFIACRRVLGEVDDPVRLLENLARVLSPRGLLFATFPSRHGRQAVRQMREAVEVLAGPEMGLEDRARIGLELFRALRPEHAIRRFEASVGGPTVPSLERFIAAYLSPPGRDYDLAEAVALVGRARLQFLYASTRWPWTADRVFVPEAVPDRLKERVEAISQQRMAVLIDALDPALHLDEYRVYACLEEFEPRQPDWPDQYRQDPEVIDQLIPHLTGLAGPAEPGSAEGAAETNYRTVTGAIGSLERRSDLLLRRVDGRTPCGEIDRQVIGETGIVEAPRTRRDRWVDLANMGFLLLESPDARQNVDCQHLGPILDRLDCACPRRWVRACELHTYCTIAVVESSDPAYPAYRGTLGRLGVEGVMACARCPDYDPEDPGIVPGER